MILNVERVAPAATASAEHDVSATNAGQGRADGSISIKAASADPDALIAGSEEPERAEAARTGIVPESSVDPRAVFLQRASARCLLLEAAELALDEAFAGL